MRDGDTDELLLLEEDAVVSAAHLRAVGQREVLVVDLGSIGVNQEHFIVPRIHLVQVERDRHFVMRL